MKEKTIDNMRTILQSRSFDNRDAGTGDTSLFRQTKDATKALKPLAHPRGLSFNSAQGPGPGPIGPGPGCDVFPAPANIGTKVRLSYFGPPPSTDSPSL